MPEIDVDQLAVALRDGAHLVDVREAEEYVAGHVPGARLVPLGQLPVRVSELDAARPVHLICASGNRSRVAAEILEDRGIPAVNVRGGTTAWARSGRDLEVGR
ncbi:rhodanese-related sulfurtransferase [Nocardioides ginsengisegetis]|uniref:Rhodanese-related sulfurtransferase n=1 Tax=Nocardioides ginsengisegetis TaxID=661491 RepID=A0A7W3PB76_9ACTN|nr:rhodanese-like domain-containing protein [Nocardioides ginsengisegetis]MBA8805545.1 rhodanese-related sulfurtransferase [Nocardioides ginsengisegetis]